MHVKFIINVFKYRKQPLTITIRFTCIECMYLHVLNICRPRIMLDI